MKNGIGIEALVAWHLLQGWQNGILQEPASGYNRGLSLDGLNAEELLALLAGVRTKLKELGYTEQPLPPPARKPDNLYINKDYSIHLGSAAGPEIKLRPLVKTVFIFFLKHPEGILFKERAEYESEMSRIYEIVAPNVSREERAERIRRLVSPEDNSFSEKCSVLNSTLDRLIKPPLSDGYKVQGANGLPRRIPLAPVTVSWV